MTPVSPIPAEVARRIRLVVFDVDGVLTDGGVYMGSLPEGETLELKRFDIQDGLAMKMLMWAGIEVVMVSGRLSRATELRARELGVQECHQDAGARKLPVVEEVLARKGVVWSEVAVLGDDLPDLPLLRKAALPAAVGNAVPEVKEAALWEGRRRGGNGAVREFCRALLEARGQWDPLVQEYLDARA